MMWVDLEKKFPWPWNWFAGNSIRTLHVRVKEEMASARAMFTDLRPSVETLVFNNGKSENLICLTGSIPAMYKGQRYSIPICIYLLMLTPHPDCAPFVYVRPPPGTTINQGLHLDATGRVYLPYLHEWKKPTHDLLGLIQILAFQFSEEFPLYSCTGSYMQPSPFVAGTPNGPMQQSINILGFKMANITVSQDSQQAYPSFNSILNGVWQGPSNHQTSPKPGSSGEKAVLHQNPYPSKPNLAIPQPSHKTEHNQHISPSGGSDKRDPGLYENVVLNPQTSSQSDKPPPVPERKHSSSKLAAIRVDKWSQLNRGECYKMLILLRGDDEFKRVVTNIAANGGSGWVNRIKQIRRIENRRLYRLYQTDLEEMERCNEKGFQNERILWHGTNDDALKNIVRDGFNRGYCGKHATAYGDGVYFAVNFEYSAKSVYSPRNDKGLKFIFQCRVLTGQYAQGSKGLKEPPMRTNEFRFDSVVDDVQNPTMFVIFKDMKVYPEYSISVE